MARPRKTGLDYFPHDVDVCLDSKMEALQALHGNEGYCFYFKLLERIYREGGELRVSDSETMQILGRNLFFWSNNAAEKFKELLDTCLKYELFDPNEYKTRKVLTSTGIKKRCNSVDLKREKSRGYDVTASETIVSASETPQIGPISEAIRGERILKDIKGKDIKEKEREDRVAYAPRILMFPEEYKSITDLCIVNTQDESFLKEEIQKASDWSLSKGKTHKDCAAFMRNWLKRSFATVRRNGGGGSGAKWGTAGSVETVRQILKEGGIV